MDQSHCNSGKNKAVTPDAPASPEAPTAVVRPSDLRKLADERSECTADILDWVWSGNAELALRQAADALEAAEAMVTALRACRLEFWGPVDEAPTEVSLSIEDLNRIQDAFAAYAAITHQSG